ncbi:MAG: PilZ domain-containing protein [Sphingomicrobium sp.]
MADSNKKPRKAERVSLRADVDFRRAGDHRYRVNILDFSPEGCRMELPVNVSPGDIIWISLPGLESIQAEVCWVKEWTVGVEFTRPLYPSVFELVRERMRTAE